MQAHNSEGDVRRNDGSSHTFVTRLREYVRGFLCLPRHTPVTTAGETTRGREPVVGGREPAVGSHEPIVGSHEPVVGGQEPAVGGQESVVEGRDPTIRGQDPVIGRQDLVTIGGQDPVIGGHEPVIGGHEPVVGGHKPVVGGPIPGIEIVDQREEEVNVHEDFVPYIVSRPIPEGKMLKKVIITVVSKDQGWSDYPDDHDTYRGSWTWFELSVGPPKDSSERWSCEVVRNLHAHGSFKEHTVEIWDEELYERANSGDVLTVWALARYPGWVNTVKKVEIRYTVE